MPHAVDPSYREELRRAGLFDQGGLAHLLALLRTAPETHVSLAEVARMAAETGHAASPGELVRQLDTLVDHGLLGRLFGTTTEPVFDTVTEPHSHLVYEETAQIVDLSVSSETLLAILRQALAERPDRVEILIRFHHDPPPTADGAAHAGAHPGGDRRRGRRSQPTLADPALGDR